MTAFHVVEHLPDPRGMLCKLATLLAPGGTMVIEVPSGDDALLTLYDCHGFQVNARMFKICLAVPQSLSFSSLSLCVCMSLSLSLSISFLSVYPSVPPFTRPLFVSLPQVPFAYLHCFPFFD